MELHIFEGGQRLIKTWILKNHSESAPDRMLVSNGVKPVHSNGTSARPQHGGQHLDRRRFPSAVRTKKSKNFSFGDKERDSVYSAEFSVTLRKVLNFNHRSLISVCRWCHDLQHIRERSFAATASLLAIPGQ